MTSAAYDRLQVNLDEIKSLSDLHFAISGGNRGRKYYVAMLNKASVVMICAAWEAFCEDLITEAVGLLTTHCVDYNHLPLLLKKSVARAVKEDKHDLSPWDLAGIGWTRKVKALATAAIEAKTGNFKHHRGAS